MIPDTFCEAARPGRIFGYLAGEIGCHFNQVFVTQSYLGSFLFPPPPPKFLKITFLKNFRLALLKVKPSFIT